MTDTEIVDALLASINRTLNPSAPVQLFLGRPTCRDFDFGRIVLTTAYYSTVTREVLVNTIQTAITAEVKRKLL